MKSFYSKKPKTCVPACKENPELKIVHHKHDPIHRSEWPTRTHAGFWHILPFFFDSPICGETGYIRFQWNFASQNEIMLRIMKYCCAIWNEIHSLNMRSIFHTRSVFHMPKAYFTHSYRNEFHWKNLVLQRGFFWRRRRDSPFLRKSRAGSDSPLDCHSLPARSNPSSGP